MFYKYITGSHLGMCCSWIQWEETFSSLTFGSQQKLKQEFL